MCIRDRYPITFIVTDIISELYGKQKANQVVTVGLLASLFMLLIVTVSDKMPSDPFGVGSEVFSQVFGLSSAAVFASMMAYLFAQYIDVRLFHFWKRLTNGKHLWLRNNASTVFSQFIDTFSVLFLLCFFEVLSWDMFGILLLNGFLFKVFFAAFDTPFVYLIVYYLRKEFGLKENEDLASIKRVYRKFAHRYHPDKTKDDETSLKIFIDAKQAYETIIKHRLHQK